MIPIGAQCLALVAFMIFILTFITKKRQKRTVLVGRPPGYPFFGNLFDLLPDVFLDSCEKFILKYGNVVELMAFNQRIYLISDIALTKEILCKRPKVFRRVLALDYAARALDFRSGLFHAHGARWQRVRKLTSPALARHHIVSNAGAILSEALALNTRLSVLADGKSSVSIKEELLTFTLRVICKSAFGIELTGDYADYFFNKQFPVDVKSIFTFFIESATFPFYDWVWRTIPFYRGVEKDATEANTRFSSLCSRIIAEKRRVIARNPQHSNHNSVIDILITKENDEGGTVTGTAAASSDNKGEDISDDEILANVKTFFVAGSETTSVTIAWAMYFLSLDRPLLSQVRSEVTGLFAANERHPMTNEEVLDASSSRSLPLTHAVIKETLRLRTPGAMVFSQTESRTEPVVLSSGLVIDPADEIVSYFDMIHWDEAVFGPDARQFVPQRWLTEDTAQLARMEESYFAFGYGPRICPGMNLAYVEAVIGLAAIVNAFNFALACPASEIRRVLTFTAQPTKLPMTLTKLCG